MRVLRGELRAEAEIAWQEQGLAGLRFSSAIDVGRWVKRIGHRGQQRVDDTIATLRARQAHPRRANGSGQLSLAEIGTELGAICERLTDGRPLANELSKLKLLARQLQQLSGRA